MKKVTPKQLTPAQQAELKALAALPDAEIDTQDIPELPDWSGGQRGLFFRPIQQQVVHEQNNQVYRNTIKEITIHWLPKDYYSLLMIVGLIIAIGYYIYSRDIVLLAIFLGILVGSTTEKIREMNQQHKKDRG